MLAILKMGGAAITDKSAYESANDETIWKLAYAAAQALRKDRKLQLIIVHGAGSFGHPQVLKYRVGSGVRTAKQAYGFCEVRNSCARLSAAVMRQLLDADVPAVLLPTGAMAMQKNKRITHFNLALVRHALALGLVPVLRGDMVLDEALGGSVCSGDQVVSYLCSKLNVARAVFGTDVDGVFNVDPKKDNKARMLRKILRAQISNLSGSMPGPSMEDVTGGMKGKLAEFAGIKCPVFVANASKPERITALLLGKSALSTEIS
ncbi:Isopentenyl phosphate kinase [Candidatus Burarchaeum australiense]|nr:Isopentenyl phosphate kinase [Candidatus Burarchaeum australiense]